MKKRNKSILQKDLSRCYVCHTRNDTHIHEVFYGSANRKKSIDYGCYVALCAKHHNMSDLGVHYNKDLDLELKQKMQMEFEKRYSHAKFMQIFNKNYL